MDAGQFFFRMYHMNAYCPISKRIFRHIFYDAVSNLTWLETKNVVLIIHNNVRKQFNYRTEVIA